MSTRVEFKEALLRGIEEGRKIRPTNTAKYPYHALAPKEVLRRLSLTDDETLKELISGLWDLEE